MRATAKKKVPTPTKPASIVRKPILMGKLFYSLLFLYSFLELYLLHSIVHSLVSIDFEHLNHGASPGTYLFSH